MKGRRGTERDMKRIIATLLVMTLAASCGGRSDRSSHSVTRFANGPITAACMETGRNGATRERCGCVQAVANKSLTSSDQALGASFFRDPHRAQEIRQSASSSHSAFWLRWKAFGDEAAKICG